MRRHGPILSYTDIKTQPLEVRFAILRTDDRLTAIISSHYDPEVNEWSSWCVDVVHRVIDDYGYLDELEADTFNELRSIIHAKIYERI